MLPIYQKQEIPKLTNLEQKPQIIMEFQVKVYQIIIEMNRFDQTAEILINISKILVLHY